MKIKKIYSEIKNEKLKNIVNINMGQSPSSEFYNKFEGFPFFQGVSDFGFKYPQINTYTRLSKKESKKGDILFSVRAPVGKLNISNSVFSIGRGLAALTVNNNYKRDYIYYILIQNKNNWKKVSNGSIFEAVNKKDIENFEIKVHKSLKQQERIAHILSMQEEQIERIKGLIKKLEKRNQYYAEKLLSGELRIRENKETGKTEFYENKEWQEFNVQGRIKKIPKYYTPILIKNCDFIKMTRGKVISKKDILNNPGDYPIYSSSTKNEGLLGKYKKYDFDQEMITWSVDGGGDLFFRKKHKYSVTNVSGIMTNTNPKVSLKYLYYLFKFQHKSFNFDYSSKAHPSVIKDLYFYTGIDIYEQLLIVNFLDKLNVEFESLQSTLTKEEKRFQWMLDNLLSGEYEVVED